LIIDCHANLGDHFTGENVSPEAYLEEMRLHGIARALICPRKGLSYSAREANAAAARMCGREPNAFMRAFRVDPWQGEGALPGEARGGENGVAAAYMNPWEDNFRCNDSRVFFAYEFLESHGFPLVMETGYPWVSHVSQLWEVAGMFPSLRILASNAGQLDLSGLSFGSVSAVLAESPNLYLGTAAAVAADWLKEAAENWAKGRVVFTTSYPMFEPEMERFRIDNGCMSDAAKREIYYDNPLRFLGLS